MTQRVACARCGCVVDYSCLCIEGAPSSVPFIELQNRVEVETYRAVIFIGGDAEAAKTTCQIFCDSVGECVTVEPTDYVYTGGRTAGVRVGFINYGRFPRSPAEIFSRAEDLARRLLVTLGQESASIVATDKTVWLSTRPHDGAGQ